MIPTVSYVAYMLLISPAMRNRSLLFIIRCLHTLRRLFATTREPSLGSESMVNTNRHPWRSDLPISTEFPGLRAPDVGNLILSELDTVAADGLCLP